MNANDRFLARDARVDAAAVKPFPNSRKVFVVGSRADVRVPMREIAQSDTPAAFGVERNSPIAVYDTSGPYTDPAANIDIRAGLPPLRAGWIQERGDTVVLARAFLGLRPRAARYARAIRDAIQSAAQAKVRPRRRQCHANALRTARHCHSGDGIHRDPREPAARRNARKPAGACHAPASGDRVSAPRFRECCHARVRAQLRSRAGARSSPPTSITLKSSR